MTPETQLSPAERRRARREMVGGICGICGELARVDFNIQACESCAPQFRLPCPGGCLGSGRITVGAAIAACPACT